MGNDKGPEHARDENARREPFRIAGTGNLVPSRADEQAPYCPKADKAGADAGQERNSRERNEVHDWLRSNGHGGFERTILGHNLTPCPNSRRFAAMKVVDTEAIR